MQKKTGFYFLISSGIGRRLPFDHRGIREACLLRQYCTVATNWAVFCFCPIYLCLVTLVKWLYWSRYVYANGYTKQCISGNLQVEPICSRTAALGCLDIPWLPPLDILIWSISLAVTLKCKYNYDRLTRQNKMIKSI